MKTKHQIIALLIQYQQMNRTINVPSCSRELSRTNAKTKHRTKVFQNTQL